jgi:hypothetical protein
MTDLPVSDSKKKDDELVESGLGVSKERREGKSFDEAQDKSLDEARDKQEVTPMTEYTRKVDLEPEVESWLEKLEKEDTSLSQPVVDPGDDPAVAGQVVLEDIEGDKDKFKVVLPLTKEEVDKKLHGKVIESARWLAEWCIKMIKMFHGKVAYRRK